MKQLRGTPLKRFLRDWRREHVELPELALVLQSVSYPANVGSLFRIADATGVGKMFLCGITPTPPNQTISKVGRDKHNDVCWYYEKQAEDALRTLRSEGYHIYALELTDASRPYHQISYPDKLCLVVGNEDHGVTRSALALCDLAMFVPMYGKGQSLNVHVCAGVVLYHIIGQKSGNPE
ncbi:MAG: tRNA methyltransferase [Anaerolineae bacterium]|nr:tRNA methyltransferase [Anaerolineae bacterium]